MSKIQFFVIAAFLATMLMLGMTTATTICAPPYFLSAGQCARCTVRCLKCATASTCLPDSCEAGSTYNNGLCDVPVVTSAASRVSTLAAVCAFGAAIVALMY